MSETREDFNEDPGAYDDLHRAVVSEYVQGLISSGEVVRDDAQPRNADIIAVGHALDVAKHSPTLRRTFALASSEENKEGVVKSVEPQGEGANHG